MCVEDKQLVLKEDILSGYFVKGVRLVYGKKNEVVALVTSSHGNVLIVEDKDGVRFPVHIDKVRDK